MPTLTVEVRSRLVGGHEGALALQPVWLELLEERITVSELIRRTVEEQVRELLVKRKLDAQEARQILDRQYLTAEQVAAQAEKGAIRYPSSTRTKVPDIDPEAEVRKALRAFKAGSYFITVDGKQMERLDEVVTFAPGTRVTFLRLMPMRGGCRC